MNQAGTKSSFTDPGRDTLLSAYDAWNLALHDWFFSGRYGNQPVYLDLEAEDLREVAASIGVASDDPAAALVDAVKQTLPLSGDLGRLFAGHQSRAIQWDSEGRKAVPPFLALLAFFSLVAEGMVRDERFNSNNYYGRLCETLGLDGTPGLTKTSVSRSYMEHVPYLWRLLNEWIEAEPATRGKPTAFAFDYRVYVGLPISQALVRERDRKALLQLFLTYRLQPGQVISRADMARLVKDWMPSAPVSNTLRRLVTSGDALARVADVACVELQAWDGELPIDEHAPDATVSPAALRVVARLRRQPRPRLVIEALVHSLRPVPEGDYRLEDPTPHAVEALSALGGRIHVESPHVEGWQAIDGGDAISIPDLLYANIRLQGHGLVIRREPRRLVVLEQDEASWAFVEVPRAHLGRTLLLLCAEDLLEEVLAIAATCARPGFRPYVAGELAGVPKGWACITDVELLRLPETSKIDLASLVPVAWTEISLGGGFRLPGRSTWLQGHLPEARVASLAEVDEVAVKLVDEQDPEATPEALGTVTESGVLALPDSLADGDYRVVIEPVRSTKVLASVALRIRSERTLRPLLGDEREPLGHPLDRTAWPMLSSVRLAEPPASGAVFGAVVVGAEESTLEATLTPPSVLGASVEAHVDPADDDVEAEEAARAGEPPDCLRTGAHYIRLPDSGPGRPAWNAKIEGYCVYCGIEKFFPARPRGRWGRNPRQRVVRQQGRRPLPAPRPNPLLAKPIGDGPAYGLDELMRSLVYARCGPWSSFESIASQVSDAPWFAPETARILCALGHLEIVLNRATHRPEAWSVAPIVLATTMVDGRAVACGLQAPQLLGALTEQAVALGGQVEVTADLSAITIVGLDADSLRLVADELSTDDVRVAVSEEPAATIVARLAPLSEVTRSLGSFVPPLATPLERWAPDENKWRRVPDVLEPGAYRTGSFPRRYGVHAPGDESRRLLRGDARLVKWIAASAAGTALLGYDAATGELECLIGGELPGLYERAAVLSSGMPPAQRGGTVIYKDVPRAVASALWEAVST